jgi:type 1 glutamine amidotransferase
MDRRKFIQSAALTGASATLSPASASAAAPKPAPKLRVLIVDGINNHDWKTATHGITEILTRAGLFTIDVSTTPPREAPASAWDTWRPAFSHYDVVVNNFNGGDSLKGIQWPAPVEAALEAYVVAGGGLVSYHAANNAFTPWPAYNQMIGLGWRPAAFGTGIAIADDDSVVYIPKGEGHAPGHPANLDFQIHVRDTHHPITQGMPPTWMHPFEQLTHGQHGPAEGLTILTYAHSPVTNQNEPMDWVRDYGLGRVYTTMLGHTWIGDPCPNLDCIGFQTLLARGVQWAATGHVTVPVPPDFPGPDKGSLHKLT